jgi:hypothetical protein
MMTRGDMIADVEIDGEVLAELLLTVRRNLQYIHDRHLATYIPCPVSMIVGFVELAIENPLCP